MMMAKKNGKKLRAGKSLKSQKSTTLGAGTPFIQPRLFGNHNETVLRL
jgi:hypothetical protein